MFEEYILGGIWWFSFQNLSCGTHHSFDRKPVNEETESEISQL